MRHIEGIEKRHIDVMDRLFNAETLVGVEKLNAKRINNLKDATLIREVEFAAQARERSFVKFTAPARAESTQGVIFYAELTHAGRVYFNEWSQGRLEGAPKSPVTRLQEWQTEADQYDLSGDWLEVVGTAVTTYALACEIDDKVPSFAGLVDFIQAQADDFLEEAENDDLERPPFTWVADREDDDDDDERPQANGAIDLVRPCEDCETEAVGPGHVVCRSCYHRRMGGDSDE